MGDCHSWLVLSCASVHICVCCFQAAYVIESFTSLSLSQILGGFPYPSISNAELINHLKNGSRLEQPDNCSGVM